jgi:DNA-binding transcriptional LysR family regulator
VGIAQPPLSRQIRALESELAVRLFARSGRRVHLTDAGRVLLEEARTSLRQVERARERARRAGRGELGRLAVAFSPVAELPLMRRLIASFAADHPEVQLELYAMEPDRHVAAVQAGTIEAGLLALPARTPDDVAVERLFAVELCAVLPRRHRLAGRARLTLAMLAEEALVLLRPQAAPGLHDAIEAMLGAAGVSPPVRSHATHVHACLTLVRAGLGVGLLPAVGDDGRTSGVVYRRLAGAGPRLTLGVVYRRDDGSGTLRAFLATVRRELGGRRPAVLACGAAEPVSRAAE